MLALAVTATLARARSFAAIGEWAAAATTDCLAAFGLDSGSFPDESTLRKLFARLDADALDAALGAQFDLDDVVATLDAMHTQTDTAEAITAAGGDYVLTVKKNMPTLYRKHTGLPRKAIPATRTTTTAKGRRITRTIKAVAVPDWIDFPGASQVAQLRRTVTYRGKTTVEVVYLITSADHTAAPPATLAEWLRGHWSIEVRHEALCYRTEVKDHRRSVVAAAG